MELHPTDHNKFKCQWFTPQEDPRDDKFFECGQPAHHKIKVHGGVTKAFVFLCDEHKTQVNNEFAKRRNASEIEDSPSKLARQRAEEDQLRRVRGA